MRHQVRNSVPKVKSVPTLLRLEVLAGLLGLAVLCLFSALADAPLQGPTDPNGVAAEGVKAPWIFVGIQLVLRWMPPLYAGVVLPLAALVVIAAVPYLQGARLPTPLFIYVIFFSVVSLTVAATIWGYLF